MRLSALGRGSLRFEGSDLALSLSQMQGLQECACWMLLADISAGPGACPRLPSKPTLSGPMRAGVSPEFQNLVSRLLDRDPSSRLTWAELCAHPFWGASPLEELSVPDAISAPRSPKVWLWLLAWRISPEGVLLVWCPWRRCHFCFGWLGKALCRTLLRPGFGSFSSVFMA